MLGRKYKYHETRKKYKKVIRMLV